MTTRPITTRPITTDPDGLQSNAPGLINLASLLCGILFGLGLSISEMTNPARVIGFLDIFGQWDATLALVMGGALAVTVPLYPRVSRLARPLFSQRFELPTTRDIDPALLIGAVLFGIGWGLGGLCPGPAIAGLATGSTDVAVFVIAMICGLKLARWVKPLLSR